ncbi:MAG: hypothetical protein U0T83_10435 [Bacteriovoracaceae bacterium]
MKASILLLLLAITFSAFASNVTVYKQWHLLPNQNTLDIEASTKLPQFESQKDIYKKIKKMVEDKKTFIIISEACEGVIDENFKDAQYGWSYKKLKAELKNPKYEDIMAFIPLKLKVYFGSKIEIICGDSNKLLKKNNLELSNLRGYFGFFIRLAENKDKNKAKFKLYAEKLIKIGKLKANANVMDFARKKSLHSMKNVLTTIKERNEYLLKSIEKNLKKNPVVIVGGLHTEDLSNKLTSKKINYELNVPLGYQEQDTILLGKIFSVLDSYSKKKQ